MSRVYFDPPLSVQRQQWLLQQLDSHKNDVLFEIGCAEGTLLKCLLAPPLWLTASENWKEGFRKATQLSQHPFLEPASVAPKQITAVDVDEQSLTVLRDAIVQQAEKQWSDYPKGPPRWYNLHVELLLGSFVDLEAATPPIDILVASEVIEHLDEDVLREFPRVVFGRLQPAVVLITTPNFDFNVHFDRGDKTHGFLDPTGRTDRILRHDDHKFEWNTAEWTTWCDDICEKYGYSVKLDGIGALQYDRRRRHVDDVEDLDTFASHAAVFTRKDSAKTDFVASLSRLSLQGDNKQPFFSHTYKATPDEAQADREGVAEYFNTQTEVDVYEEWMDEALRVACVGQLEAFIPNPSVLSVRDDTVWLQADAPRS